MIYTVTFNPAIDYVLHTSKLVLGEVNRSQKEEIYVGGKGINVSLVLKELGILSKALGFVAGFTGEAIEKSMQQNQIETDFVHVKHGFSRINVKMKSQEETELNGQGPDISKEEIGQLLLKLQEIQEGDTIVLAGSIPDSMPQDMYEKILSHLQEKEIRMVVDATGELLLRVMHYHPFLVKPNHLELGEIFGVTLRSLEEIEIYARKLKKMGAENVLVSMAGNGALLIDGNGKTHHCGICKGKVKNSVGAGDSMVAGFLAGCEKQDYEYALKLGTAAGGATAFSSGLGKREEIFRLLQEL